MRAVPAQGFGDQQAIVLVPRCRECALGVAQVGMLALVERGFARFWQGGARGGDQIIAQGRNARAGFGRNLVPRGGLGRDIAAINLRGDFPRSGWPGSFWPQPQHQIGPVKRLKRALDPDGLNLVVHRIVQSGGIGKEERHARVSHRAGQHIAGGARNRRRNRRLRFNQHIE